MFNSHDHGWGVYFNGAGYNSRNLVNRATDGNNNKTDIIPRLQA